MWLRRWCRELVVEARGHLGEDGQVSASGPRPRPFAPFLSPFVQSQAHPFQAGFQAAPGLRDPGFSSTLICRAQPFGHGPG